MPGSTNTNDNGNQTYNSRSNCEVLSTEHCINDPRCEPCSYRNTGPAHMGGPPTYTSCVPVGKCMGDQSGYQVQSGGSALGCGPNDCGPCDPPNFCRRAGGYLGACICYGGQDPSDDMSVMSAGDQGNLGGNVPLSCGGRPFNDCNSLPSCEYCWTAGSNPTSPGECVPAGTCNSNMNEYQTQSGMGNQMVSTKGRALRTRSVNGTKEQVFTKIRSELIRQGRNVTISDVRRSLDPYFRALESDFVNGTNNVAAEGHFCSGCTSTNNIGACLGGTCISCGGGSINADWSGNIGGQSYNMNLYYSPGTSTIGFNCSIGLPW
tara:strand:- start:4650 stop:5609 length:960 start_codon:yes stop_codon:yes gene_type:complete